MLVAHYIVVITISAFLLFLVQPIYAKALLPTLGGSPAVWITSMLFFQTILLGGYLYAHASQRWWGIKYGAKIHALLLALSLVLLPITVEHSEIFNTTYQPVFWMLATLGLSIGALFFMLSANAPLVQLWFAHSGHTHAHNPYFLYSASNIGSFAALFAYPTLIEPTISLNEQMSYWSYGYAALALLLIMLLYRLHSTLYHSAPKVNKSTAKEQVDAKSNISITSATWTKWLMLAAVPSSLMLGVTQYITTDLAAVPFLWILPLSLYLLSFVLVFSRYQLPFRLSKKIATPFLIITLLLVVGGITGAIYLLPVHIITFFICCMILHGQLAETKPPASQLTFFYFIMSLGGVLGSICNVIIAPTLFNDVWEYPVALLLALFLHKQNISVVSRKTQYITAVIILIVIAAVYHAYFLLGENVLDAAWVERNKQSFIVVFLICVGTYLYAIRTQRFQFTICVAGLWILCFYSSENTVLFKDRNFFGVSKVEYVASEKVYRYLHGTTMHGLQSTEPEKRLTPISYYSSIIELYAAAGSIVEQYPLAITGLGVGTLTCMAVPDQKVDVYEIDPVVNTIAHDTRFFTYMRDCPGIKNVKLGDARLLLQTASDDYYGMIIMDAYSSDSLPVHLITHNAVDEYFDKLRDDGLLVFHISNRYLNLAPILANIAHAKNIHVMEKTYPGNGTITIPKSVWIVMTYNTKLSEMLRAEYAWKAIAGNDNALWSDDYSNLLEAFWEKYK